MIFSFLATLLGGLGLFLHGMSTLTSGLQQAAGTSLRNILKKSTYPLYKGVFSGFTITALVQSSSAVTVAVIGFVNAGIMDLFRSMGVIYGSNIGTTITGWLVTAIGYSVHIQSLALPLIGFGVILRLTGKKNRRAHIGDALVGFGLFFLGIDLLQEGFGALGKDLDLNAIASGHIWNVPAFVGVGFLLTLLMQSSSGSMAVVLTAAISGMIGMESAAAAVIGANIGTTSTAALAVIGATSNAKKVAWGHIIFNLVTGAVALMLLPVLLRTVGVIQANVPVASGAAGTLALFHTTFNILGLLIMWPFTHKLVNFLERRIGESGSAQAQYLDQTLISTPRLAIDAVSMELDRIGQKTRQTLQNLLFEEQEKHLSRTRMEISNLVESCQAYSMHIQQQDMLPEVSSMVPIALRIAQYYRSIGENIQDLREQQILLPQIADETIKNKVDNFLQECRYILQVADHPCSEDFENADKKLEHLTSTYHRLKEALLQAGAENRVDMSHMVQYLDYYSLVHKTLDRTLKAAVYWFELRTREEACRTS